MYVEQRFTTKRLIIDELFSAIPEKEKNLFFSEIINVLTPSVVKNLPPYFHNIKTVNQAELWLNRILSENRALIVKEKETYLIVGFLFVYEEDNNAHIGYLFGESFWGVGLATELLTDFVQWCHNSSEWNKLVGGVNPENLASINLLKKLGFIQESELEDTTLVFEYNLRLN